MASTRSSTAAPDDDTSGAPLTSWYTQGVTDGLGDRLLMFDNAATGPIELLRVKPEFATTPGFESALRSRFSQLTAFNHPNFAQARVVNHLDNGGGLTVASAHVTGTRVAALFEARRPSPGMHPGAVCEVFGDLVSAIGDLHKLGEDIAHGVLSADRVILTFDRRLVITDYIFSSALERMRLSAERLWNDFGLVGDPSTKRVHLDQRGDLTQLGLLMLCLVLGRRVTPDEYPAQIPSLLNDFTTASDRRAPDLTSRMRGWLEQAIDPSGFESVSDAARALTEGPARPRYIDLHRPKPLAGGPSSPKQLVGSTAHSPTAVPDADTHEVPHPGAAESRRTETVQAPSADAAAREVSSRSVALALPNASQGEMPSLVSRDAVASSTAGEDVSGGPRKEPSLIAPTLSPGTSGSLKASPTGAAGAPELLAPSDDDRLWPTIFEAAIAVGGHAETADDARKSNGRHHAATSTQLDVAALARPRDDRDESVAAADDDEGDIPPDLFAIDSRMKPIDVESMTFPAPSILSLRGTDSRASTPDTSAMEVDAPTHATPVLRWVVAALVVLAISQGAIILRLLLREPRGTAVLRVDSPTPGDRVLLDGKDIGVTPLDVSFASPRSVVKILPRATDTAASWSGAAQQPPSQAPSPAASNIGLPADAKLAVRSVDAATARTGAVRVVSPIPLQVMAGKVILGSSDQGPVVITPGAHDLDFSNASVGFRTSQRVHVEAGNTAVVRIDPPSGLLSVTARPWAQVWIDGRKVGDTPIANMPIAVGEHEVVFRNPNLGERSQKTVVQINRVTRVSASFNP